MKYKYSDIDHSNLKWFLNDSSKATLVEIELRTGEIRGLKRFKISLKYPISVIAGANCSGKSTILALAACAFHNESTGFKPRGRKLTYYTFSDFFIQSNEEVNPEGIQICYGILHNGWRKSNHFPNGIGLGRQLRIKKKGGKWNAYYSRVDRNVVFFGIERVVPHSEKSVSKSYRHSFKKGEMEGYEKVVQILVGKILGNKYSDFWFSKHHQYRLPHVSCNGNTYSGFNMGAGENALFEILSTIYSCPPGVLLVIDEIELGLHEKAQIRFIKELKTICKERQIQIICTTHSSAIMDNIPPEGRFFIENHLVETVIIPGISSKYAAGKLSGKNSNELDIYVEDDVSEHLVTSCLSAEIRRRINIRSIGSADAVIRQLSSHFRTVKDRECLAILDGDQAKDLDQHKIRFFRYLENIRETVSYDWFDKHITCLPGNTYPELWMLNQIAILNLDSIAAFFHTDSNELRKYIDEALISGKHNELNTLKDNLSLSPEFILSTICHYLANEKIKELEILREAIHRNLNSNYSKTQSA